MVTCMGIPCDLASLARVPLRFAKGTDLSVVWAFLAQAETTLKPRKQRLQVWNAGMTEVVHRSPTGRVALDDVSGISSGGKGCASW